MAQPEGPRGGLSECYTAKRRGSSGQGGTVITPWERPEPSPPHLALESFSTPRAYEPPHLAALKEDLALGCHGV